MPTAKFYDTTVARRLAKPWGRRRMPAGLLDLDPAEQVLPADRFQQRRMVGRPYAPGSRRSPRRRCPRGPRTRTRTGSASPSDAPAPCRSVTTAADGSGYCQDDWRDLGVAASADPDLRAARRRTRRPAPRHRPCPAARDGCCSPTWSSTDTATSRATSWPRHCGANPTPPPSTPGSTRCSPSCAASSAPTPSTGRAHAAPATCPSAWVDLEAAVDAIHRAESAVAQRRLDPRLGAGPASRCSSPSAASCPAKTPHGSTRSATNSPNCGCAHWSATPPPNSASAEPNWPAPNAPGGNSSDSPHCARAATATSCKPSPPRTTSPKPSHVYQQLCDSLRDQLGVSPSPATRNLYQRLLSAT